MGIDSNSSNVDYRQKKMYKTNDYFFFVQVFYKIKKNSGKWGKKIFSKRSRTVYGLKNL